MSRSFTLSMQALLACALLAVLLPIVQAGAFYTWFLPLLQMHAEDWQGSHLVTIGCGLAILYLQRQGRSTAE